jgi:probable phosphoglycerate mutase
MAAALDDVDPAAVTVLVSHGDAIRTTIAYLHGVKPHGSEWVEVANGSVTRVGDAVTWLT